MAARRLSPQGLASRYLTLSAGEAFSKLCVLAAFAYLARVLGPHDFGLIELSLSVTLIFALGVENGLGSFGARSIAADPSRVPRLLAHVLVLRAILAIVAYAGILVLSAQYGMPGLGVLAIYGLTVLFVPLFTQWVFQGLGHMRWVASGTALRNFVFSAFVFLFVRSGSDARLVALGEVVGVAALVTFNVIVLRYGLRTSIDWRGAVRGAGRLLREAWTIGASELTWAGLWYSPSVILGALAEPEDVAWLAGSLRIVLALHTFVWLYFFNLLPVLSKAYAEGVESWRRLADRSMVTSMWIAILVAVGVTLAAPWLVTVVYGGAYDQAVRPLRLVIWMIPVAWLSGHFRYTLIATGHQRQEFQAAAITAGVTMTLAFFLVPAIGSLGGAVALLVGGIVNAGLTGVAMARSVGRLAVTRATLGPGLAGALGLVVGASASPMAGPVAGFILGSVVYGAIAVGRDDELRRLALGWLRR